MTYECTGGRFASAQEVIDASLPDRLAGNEGA